MSSARADYVPLPPKKSERMRQQMEYRATGQVVIEGVIVKTWTTQWREYENHTEVGRREIQQAFDQYLHTLGAVKDVVDDVVLVEKIERHVTTTWERTDSRTFGTYRGAAAKDATA